MESMKKLVAMSLVAFSLFFVSCASGYKEIMPDSQNYLSSEENSGVLLEYKYNVLKNKKYNKKENKKGVKVASLKITNKSGRDLIFGKNLQLVNSKGVNLPLATNKDVYNVLKQKSGFYFFYLLLTPMQIGGSANEYGEIEDGVPAGLVIGPGLALGNFLMANSANKKFNKELTDFDLYGRTIKNGETIYGLIGISSDSHEKIGMKLVD